MSGCSTCKVLLNIACKVLASDDVRLLSGEFIASIVPDFNGFMTERQRGKRDQSGQSAEAVAFDGLGNSS